MKSFGIYDSWNSETKELPRIAEFTTEVRAELDVEFGFIVNIVGAKNRELDYCIYHPGILGDDGEIRAPFDGTVFVKTNNWNFYLGDTIWEPVEDKLGEWRMTLEIDGDLIAEKTFLLHLDSETETPNSQSRT